MAGVVTEQYGQQIRSAAQYVRDCRTLYENALKSRNNVIVTAVDNGYTGHQAARDAGVKQPHIIRILSNSQPDLLIEAAQE
jgi:hypothetical protein